MLDVEQRKLHFGSWPQYPPRLKLESKRLLNDSSQLSKQAKLRDIGEADTSTLVKDILAELFGYDKYSEITAEFQIKGTYCDLAIKINGKLVLLVEVKAVNIELKEAHTKQAIDYAANQGVEWVILTNAQSWMLYKVSFGQPISQDLLMLLNFQALSAKNDSDMESVFLLTREAQGKSLLNDYHEQRQALSRYCVGAVVLSEPVVSVIRRELKRLSPDVKIDVEEIARVLTEEVIKRDILEGDRATEAKKKLSRAAGKQLRAKADKADAAPADSPQPPVPIANSEGTGPTTT